MVPAQQQLEDMFCFPLYKLGFYWSKQILHGENVKTT
jgi:hypothetical protein